MRDGRGIFGAHFSAQPIFLDVEALKHALRERPSKCARRIQMQFIRCLLDFSERCEGPQVPVILSRMVPDKLQGFQRGVISSARVERKSQSSTRMEMIFVSET